MVVLLLALYLAAYPFVVVAYFSFPSAMPITAPVIRAVYAPVVLYARADLPGTSWYRHYDLWVKHQFRQVERLHPPQQAQTSSAPSKRQEN